MRMREATRIDGPSVANPTSGAPGSERTSSLYRLHPSLADALWQGARSSSITRPWGSGSRRAAGVWGGPADEIADLLRLDDGAHCEEARRQGERKLGEVRARLADLRQIEKALSDLVARCCEINDAVQCPLIAALYTHGKRR